MSADVIDLAARRPRAADGPCCDTHRVLSIEERLRKLAASHEGHLLVAAEDVDRLLEEVADELQAMRTAWPGRRRKP